MFLQVRFGDSLLEQSDNAGLLPVYFSGSLFEQDDNASNLLRCR